jgi:hypothetical protein
MKKLHISFILIFLSLNINAAISQSGITNLKQLDKNGIINLVNGNQLTGFISDGPFEGPITQTYFKNGTYETVYENKIFKGKWRAEGELNSSIDDKKMCTKNNNATNWACFYWYTGSKDGETYAYIIAQGKIFHQYHEIISVVKLNQEKKKAEKAEKAEKKKKAEEKKKALEAKRIADAKKAKEAGYSSYSEMQAEEKKKALEAKRIADAKKAEEKKKALEAKRIADAKKAEEKKKALEAKRIADAKKAEEKRLRLQNYPGFKDLKPGLSYEDVLEICTLQKVNVWGQKDDEGSNSNWVRCYEINNIKFKAYYSYDDLLRWLSLDMGPIVNTGGFLSVFGENDSNIFIKMKNTFDKKYTLDYGYSERDRQLFNESEKTSLYRVYSKGQVVLALSRKEKDYSTDLWLHIYYLDPAEAKEFLEKYRPVRASEDDF